MFLETENLIFLFLNTTSSLIMNSMYYARKKRPETDDFIVKHPLNQQLIHIELNSKSFYCRNISLLACKCKCCTICYLSMGKFLFFVKLF